MPEESQDGEAADEDEATQAVENGYHISLVELLRHPSMYTTLGLSGPPQTITHPTLEEQMMGMRVVH